MLRKSVFGVLTLLFAFCIIGCGGENKSVKDEKSNVAFTAPKSEVKISSEAMQMVDSAVSDYFANFKSEISDGQDGDNSYVITHDGKTMRFFMEKKGSPDKDGKYPLYITLHGGGGTAPSVNDDQWRQMFSYYKGSVENGIYIACRGITDTWDLHFQQDSYVLYDSLIKNMIADYNADPNRVYLLGFSAGGDGVYQILPRMADRFAAGNMSSGHPNGVRLINLANCPISIQVGVRDYYSRSAMRSVRAAEFEKTLTEYADALELPYEHRVLVHVPAGHNYVDYDRGARSQVLKAPTSFADKGEKMLDEFIAVLEKTENVQGYDDGEKISRISYLQLADDDFNREITKVVTRNNKLAVKEVNPDAVTYVSQFTRNPLPKEIVWDLETRPESQKSFYWLQADSSVNKGIITAEIDSKDNTIYVETEDVNGDFYILVSPYMLDVSKPIHIVTPKEEVSAIVEPSQDLIEESLQDRGDPNFVYVEKIKYNATSGEIEE